MHPAEGPGDEGRLAGKINHLIAVRHPDTRRRPGYTRLAEEIRESTGARLSGTYLWELATGRKRNPTVDQVAVLASYFGVPAEYFLNDEVADRVNAQISLASALRNAKVRDIALRADGLAPQTLDTILAIVTEARKVQQLSPVEDVE
ncbi:hypothetical protein SAMN05421504_107409 [Amycolatopsis xylanica]|uniref:HTH cro/C1-type domain-containing protein n=1 Tax=Amycolatopsis xylanica TaxID=589385 RepID=A0A1H3NQK9_9PSEU|nr:hypothetical protein [Amycolatopsis xylanica]SDY91053.1 hypothetical protein SAMN05421504_107409 [Amycolatopsis xylanica]